MELTKVEREAILTLINLNFEEGWHFGNKEQYFKRLNRIRKKLSLPKIKTTEKKDA